MWNPRFTWWSLGISCAKRSGFTGWPKISAAGGGSYRGIQSSECFEDTGFSHLYWECGTSRLKTYIYIYVCICVPTMFSTFHLDWTCNPLKPPDSTYMDRTRIPRISSMFWGSELKQRHVFGMHCLFQRCIWKILGSEDRQIFISIRGYKKMLKQIQILIIRRWRINERCTLSTWHRMQMSSGSFETGSWQYPSSYRKSVHRINQGLHDLLAYHWFIPNHLISSSPLVRSHWITIVGSIDHVKSHENTIKSPLNYH